MKILVLIIASLFVTGAQAERGKPSRPEKPPIEQTKTPYNLEGVKGDCGIIVHEFGTENRRGRDKKIAFANIETSFLPNVEVKLTNNFRRGFSGIDKETGQSFNVYRGLGVNAVTPLSRGTLVVQKGREIVHRCQILILN